MNRLRRFGVAATWVLVATLLAGAGTQHNHSLFADLLDSASSASESERLVTTHEDGPSSPLHWDRVIRVEAEGCVACHAQRGAEIARPLEPGHVLEVRGEVASAGFSQPARFSPLSRPSRGPPATL